MPSRLCPVCGDTVEWCDRVNVVGDSSGLTPGPFGLECIECRRVECICRDDDA